MKCLPAIWKSQIKSFATNLSRDFVCRQKSSPLLPAQTSFPKQGLSMWHRWFQLLLLEAVDPGTTRLRLKLLGYCKYRYWALCISMPFLYIFILFTSLYHLALFPTVLALGNFPSRSKQKLNMPSTDHHFTRPLANHKCIPSIFVLWFLSLHNFMVKKKVNWKMEEYRKRYQTYIAEVVASCLQCSLLSWAVIQLLESTEHERSIKRVKTTDRQK